LIDRRGLTARKGAVIVLVAIILPALMMFVGFSVDLAHMQRTRTELRVATDLAAKSAAAALSETNSQSAAILAGKEVAESNRVAGAALTLDDSDFEFGRSTKQSNGSWTFASGSSPLNSVRVTWRRTTGSPDGPVSLFFSGLFGGGGFEPSMRSAATFVDVDICLVLDRSSSMKLPTSSTSGTMATSNSRFCQTPKPDSRWIALDNAVDIFLSEVSGSGANEKVASVTFGSNYTSCGGIFSPQASIDQDLTSNLALVSAAMDVRNTTIWNGATEIDAGILLGRQVLTGAASRPLAEKVMIVLTDGVYTGADPVPQATAAALAGIKVHTITFSAAANIADMQEVAAEGGGSHYHAPDPATLNEIFRELAGTITILTE
jgi:hypothetical protein